MSYYLLDALALIYALACLRLLRSLRNRSRTLPLPPGPKGLPLIGNVLDLQDPDLWETARKWGEKYGPIVHVKAFGTSFIYVNSYPIAVDLFEKRGNMYSSRPKNTMFELEGWEWFISLMPYGDELRRSRQLLHRFLQPNKMEDYADLQRQSVHRMLDRLLSNRNRFPEILRQAMGETILALTYGYQAQENNDPFIKVAERGIEAVVVAEEPFLVNLFPALRYLPTWFPGASFKKIAEEGYRASMAMYHEPYEMAMKKLSDGTADPSVISRLHDSYVAGDAVINDESLIKKVTGTLYGAGADTTVSSLSTFFLAMVLYPEVQRRAQEELDQVVGKDTLPSFNDRPNLPYLEAIIKETFRWQPVAPLAVAHATDEDDEYNGYLIPKRSAIFPNIWAMLRDPDEYPEPSVFIPERWLPSEGRRPPLDAHKAFFGMGRRICPGRHLVDNMVFIGAASILAAFNVSKALDKNGVPVTPKVEYTPHFVRHPKPFPYELSPRSEKIQEVIRQSVESSV